MIRKHKTKKIATADSIIRLLIYVALYIESFTIYLKVLFSVDQPSAVTKGIAPGEINYFCD